MSTTEIVFESSAQDFWRGIVELICGKSHGLWIGGFGDTIEIIGELPKQLRKGFKPVRMFDQYDPRAGVLWESQVAVWHLTKEARSGDPRIGIPTTNSLVDLLSRRQELIGRIREGK